MKAVAVFPQTHELRLIDVEEPHIERPSDVKVRMLEVGICGTDKEICRFEYGTPPEGSDFLIIGHESLGEVVEVGPEVANLSAGDLVVTMVRRPCSDPLCRPCRAGHPDFCSTGDFTERGIKGRHGFMAEYVVDDAEYMHVVAPACREVAVLVEPLTIATKALTQALRVLQRLPWFDPEQLDTIQQIRQVSSRNGKTYHALVLGAGAVGLLGAMALRTVGFETYVYDRQAPPNPKSDLVESIGAHYIGEKSVQDFQHLIGDIALVYEATGASQLAFRAIKVLAPNSIFIFTGVPSLGAANELDTDIIMRNAVLYNQVIMGTVNAGKEAFELAIRGLGISMARWPTAVQSLITGRYPLQSYRELLLGQAGGIKNVLCFSA